MNTDIKENSSSLKILLIEDDKEFAFLLKFSLSKGTSFAPEIELVETLEKALQMLEEKTFNLILLDLLLPDSGGIQAFTKIQAKAKEIPIIIMTGLDNDDFAIDAVRKGAEDYLIKADINPKLLSRIVHHAIDRHHIREKLTLVTKKLHEANLKLEQISLLDPLTELYNRRGLQQLLTRELQLSARHGWNLLTLFIDIDDFKQINDTFGHSVGDILLKEIVKKIKASVRISDHVARMGGDEFILLLPQTPLKEGVQLAERLRLAIADTVIYLQNKETLRVTVSIGVSKVPKDISSIEELLAVMDPLLYESKKNGKNRISLKNEQKETHTNGNGRPSNEIVETLREGHNFIAVKQPIVDLSNQTTIGYEFLSRLKKEKLCMPDDFFRVALENNMLTLVDHYCFKSCVKASSALEKKVRSHINLFPTTIIDIPLPELIEKLSVSNGSCDFCLEISEHQILGDPSYLIGPVEAFKQHGITIAVDDVGFGHTCLESLILLEPDIIKIDKKYVRGISRNNIAIKSLKRILKVSEDLGAEIIAEGIESQDDLEALRELGVKYGQGFFLGKPA